MSRHKGRPVSDNGRFAKAIVYRVEYYTITEGWKSYDGVMYSRDIAKDVAKKLTPTCQARVIRRIPN